MFLLLVSYCGRRRLSTYSRTVIVERCQGWYVKEVYQMVAFAREMHISICVRKTTLRVLI